MPAWYCKIRGKASGPLSSERVRQLAASGRLKPADYLRQSDRGSWKRCCKVRGLTFGYSPSPEDASLRWYCKTDAGVKGPFAAAEIVALGQAGQIFPNDLLRSASSRAWKRAGSYRGMQFADQTRSAEDPVVLSSSHSNNAKDALASMGAASVTRWELMRRACGSLHAVSAQSATGLLILLATVIPCVLPVFGHSATPWTAVLLAACGGLLGGGVYGLRFRPTRCERRCAAAAFLFTLVFGATTLLQFTQFAVSASASEASWNDGPLWLVKGIGAAYETAVVARHENAGWREFCDVLIGNIASCGVCEEALKLLPVAVALAGGQVVSRRGAIFLGAMSGLAFGLAEGLWIVTDSSTETVYPLSMAVMRLVGCPLGHAALTAISARLLFIFAGYLRWRDQAAGVLLLGLGAALMVAVPHGLYNTCLAMRMPGFAGLTMTIVAFLVIHCDDDFRAIDEASVCQPHESFV